ncbi:MAG: DUF2203 domain-containing protein [Candidatus Omnitrophica bacterium]|nr:DUF2203 domain-containing protein [Candidatus Omnitrophota bacterium]
MEKKYFTPKEVNKRLPLIKQILSDILAKGAELKQISIAAGSSQEQAAYEKAMAKVNVLVDELENLGCFYKDWSFEKGLVDFPAVINGQEVMLCWQGNEPDVRWYHAVDGGYQGRCLIPEELLDVSNNPQQKAPEILEETH